MPLLSLPNELLSITITETIPESFENYALSCRRIHELSKPWISEYRHLKEELISKYEHCGDHYKKASYVNPIELLDHIMQRPFITRYIKFAEFSQIEVKDIEARRHPKTDKSDGGRSLLKASSVIPRALVSSSPTLRIQEGVPLVHHDIDAWYEQILYGHPGPVITLLLTLLTHLNSLSLWDTWKYEREYLNSIMMTIATDILTTSDSCTRGKLPLSRLEMVYLHCEDDEDGTPLQTLAPFIALPSLRTSSGHHIESDYSDFIWPFPGHDSKVEKIIFTESAISAEKIHRFLEPLRSLKSLYYSHNCLGGGSGYLWNGGGFLNAVIACAGEYLEELHLNIGSVMSLTRLESFHPFKKLRKLYFYAPLLLGDFDEGKGDEAVFERHGQNPPELEDLLQRDQMIDLWDLMPISLEELTVKFSQSPWESKQWNCLFDDVGYIKRSLLHQLRKVTLEYHLSKRRPRGNLTEFEDHTEVVFVDT